MVSLLAERQAAIDMDGLASDMFCIIGQQEGNRCCNVIGICNPFHRGQVGGGIPGTGRQG